MGPMLKLDRINRGQLDTANIAPVMSVAAPNECTRWIAEVISLESHVEICISSRSNAAWHCVIPNLNQVLPQQRMRTELHSRVLRWLNATALRLNPQCLNPRSRMKRIHHLGNIPMHL